MAKITLPAITNGQDLSTLNNNFALVATALNTNALYRTNIVGEPNSMSQDLDFNGHAAYNLSDLTVNGVSISITLGNAVTAASGSAAAALVSANNAAASNTAAGNSAASASTSAAAAAASAGAAGTLKTVNNLSDVASLPTALVNLGLNNVNNTTDLGKPVSTATSTALGLKANLITPQFSGSIGLSGANPVVNVSDSSTGKPGYTWSRSAVQQWQMFMDTDNSLSIARYVGGVFQGNTIKWDSANGDLHLTGRTSGSALSVGEIGEVMTFNGATSFALPANTISGFGGGLTLTAGIWDIQATCNFTSPTASWGYALGISTTGAFGGIGTLVTDNQNRAANTSIAVCTPVVRMNVSISTSLFALGEILAQAGTGTVTLIAKRVL
jgi:hypothetical protein